MITYLITVYTRLNQILYLARLYRCLFMWLYTLHYNSCLIIIFGNSVFGKPQMKWKLKWLVLSIMNAVTGKCAQSVHNLTTWHNLYNPSYTAWERPFLFPSPCFSYIYVSESKITMFYVHSNASQTTKLVLGYTLLWWWFALLTR